VLTANAGFSCPHTPHPDLTARRRPPRWNQSEFPHPRWGTRFGQHSRSSIRHHQRSRSRRCLVASPLPATPYDRPPRIGPTSRQCSPKSKLLENWPPLFSWAIRDSIKNITQSALSMPIQQRRTIMAIAPLGF
jgi:hypothetical protein